MIYNLKYNNLLSSTDGSIENIQDPFDKYDIINYYYILPEAGELYYEGQKYEITEPSILFNTFTIEKDKAPEIVIVPCASAIDRLAELREMRNNYMKSRDCGNCEKVYCDCCPN
jgi:hypothetical protein